MPLRDVIGHRRLLSLLARAVARGTLPPALLFAGPGGVGKQKTALALAQALNCLTPVLGPATSGPMENPQPPTSNFQPERPSTPNVLGVGSWELEVERNLDLDACGDCASCRRIARGVHPDILILAPGDTGKIWIDDVRDVLTSAGYRPFEGRRRVAIINEADAMTPQAQNALLKMLEEPPSASVFILVSSMPDALLPTVLSRCPRLRFGPLTAADVAQALIADHKYTEADARAAAMEAEGSIGRALALQSADVVDARDTAQRLLEHLIRNPDPARRIGVAKDLAGKKGSPASERDQLASCLRALSSLLRDVGILASGGDAQLLANADLQAVLRRLSATFTTERSLQAFTAVDQALAALERNASPKVVADWLVLQL